MRTLVPSILACLALAAFGSGCGNPERAPLDVNWTFGTLDCDQVGIETIHVQIDREILNPSDFSCIDRSGGITFGAHLGNFLLGQYTITVIGFDATGAEVIEGTRTITVQRGQNVVQVDAGGAVTLQWTFGGGATCADAGVTAMNLSVDGTLITGVNGSPDIPCTQAGQDGAQIAPLLAGAHSFDLVAFVGADPNPTYAASGLNIAVQDGQDRAFLVDLPFVTQPLTATADLRFTFSGQSCAAARVDTVRVRVDPDPNGIGGIDAGTVPCNANGIDGAIVTGLQPGIHSFAISGIRSTTLVYTTTKPPFGRFEVGLTTQVTVDATPAGSGLAAPGPTALSTSVSGVRAAPRQAPKAFAVRAPDAN